MILLLFSLQWARGHFIFSSRLCAQSTQMEPSPLQPPPGDCHRLFPPPVRGHCTLCVSVSLFNSGSRERREHGQSARAVPSLRFLVCLLSRQRRASVIRKASKSFFQLGSAASVRGYLIRRGALVDKRGVFRSSALAFRCRIPSWEGPTRVFNNRILEIKMNLLV